jgi:hypothetical protein
MEITNLNDIMDSNLVSYVFKEVLSHFKAYKKNPSRFEALTSRLNKLEKQAFESLIEAFWDIKVENLKL